jgi:hypothetical protein
MPGAGQRRGSIPYRLAEAAPLAAAANLLTFRAMPDGRPRLGQDGSRARRDAHTRTRDERLPLYACRGEAVAIWRGSARHLVGVVPVQRRNARVNVA